MVIFLSFIYGITIFYLSGFFPYTSLIISFVFLFLLFIHKYKIALLRLSTISAIIIFSAIGFFYAKLSYIPPPTASELAGNTIKVKGVIKSQKLSSSYKGDAYLQYIEVINASTVSGEKLNLKELRAINETKLYTNKIYYITGHFSKDGYSLNPSSNYNYLPTLYILSSEEVEGIIPNFFESTRQRLNNYIVTAFSDKSSAFLLSITTGERIFLTNEMKNAFNITGLAHILSISGSHFGLLFFILFSLFRLIFLYLPYKVLARLTIYISPSQLAGILTAPFLIFYLGISSLSIPTIRAFIMITFFLVGLLIGRKGFWLNTLTIAAFIIVLIDPSAITDLSAQLSFIAVLCIGIVVEKLRDDDCQDEMPKKEFENLFSRFSSFIFKNFKNSLLVSLSASFGTAPLVAYYFHYFSLISPLTNLLITPFIGFLILPLILVTSMIYLISDIFPFISLIDKLTLFILNLIENIAGWNYIDIKIPEFPLILVFSFYSGLLIFLFVNYSKKKNDKNSFILSYAAPLSIAILPMLVYSTVVLIEPKTLKITFLDVGQGDASVLELSDNRVIVIDTGKKGYQVGEYLRYKGIKNIDAIAISHMQSDHSGGIEYLLSNFKVNEIWISGVYGNSILPIQEYRYRKLMRGDVINGSGYKINVLHPHDEFYTNRSRGEENNYSLVLRIDGNKNSFLFTGDIEFEAQEDLSNLGQHLKSTVIKVPHHGSKSSGHELFYSLVNPKIAIISTGRKNPHRHPHEEIILMIRDSYVLRTDRDGAIRVKEMKDGNLSIITYQEFKFKKPKNIDDEIFNIKRLFSVW